MDRFIFVFCWKDSGETDMFKVREEEMAGMADAILDLVGDGWRLLLGSDPGPTGRSPADFTLKSWSRIS